MCKTENLKILYFQFRKGALTVIHSQTFFVMDNFFTLGERYDVTILRVFGSGTVTLAASATNPASFTLEYV